MTNQQFGMVLAARHRDPLSCFLHHPFEPMVPGFYPGSFQRTRMIVQISKRPAPRADVGRAMRKGGEA